MYKRNNDIKEPMPSYIGSGSKLANAIKKHGVENFKREIICWCLNQEAMDSLEKFFIKSMNATDINIGYNICEGGQSLMPKELVSLYGPDNPNYGNKWTTEMKMRMSEIAKKRNNKGENNPNYGNRWSNEQRKRASKNAIATGRCRGVNNGRATKVICVETGKIYDMISDVAMELGYSAGAMSSYISRNKKINGKTYIKLKNNSPS